MRRCRPETGPPALTGTTLIEYRIFAIAPLGAP
jgi:hypothetical protein